MFRRPQNIEREQWLFVLSIWIFVFGTAAALCLGATAIVFFVVLRAPWLVSADADVGAYLTAAACVLVPGIFTAGWIILLVIALRSWRSLRGSASGRS